MRNDTHEKNKMLSFEMITRWFNMKAILDVSKERVTLYKDFYLLKSTNYANFWAIHLSRLVLIYNGRK